MTQASGRQVVVITGGAGGVGSVVARTFAASGAAVVVSDYGVTLDGKEPNRAPAETLVAELVAAGGEATAHFGDVADFEVARDLISVAVQHYGQLDAVVTSHGIFLEGSIFDIEAAEWDAVIRNHLTGTFAVVHHAATQMREQGSGSIVCVTSSSGLEGNPVMTHYAAAKAGVVGLVKSTALAAGAFGINANAIIPNAATRVTARPSSGASTWWKGDPPDASLGAKLAVVLASTAARHITGQVFSTTGDRLARWNHSVEERAEQRPGWTIDLIRDSVTGFLECTPLRRFGVYGYPMPAAVDPG